MATTRREDEERTIAAGEFGKALYMKAGLYSDMYYINDIPLQKSGIDIIMDTPTGPIYIDEKMAINQRHKNLTTYSLELSSNNNRDKDGNAMGWFTSPDSKTTHYAFTWFQSDSAINVVSSWQTALVSKDAIKSMLKNDWIDAETIKDEFLGYVDMHLQGKPLPDSIQIRERLDDNGRPKSYEWRLGDYKLVHSVHLKEQPVNIVVPKAKLMRLADFVINKDGQLVTQDKIMDLRDVTVGRDGSLTHRDPSKRMADFILDGNGSLISKEQLNELKPSIIDRNGRLVPNDQLMRAIEAKINGNGVNVQNEIQKAHQTQQAPFPVLSPNQIKQIERGDRAPGELSLSSCRYTHKTGKIRNAQDGDFLYVEDNPRDAKNRVATYSAELEKWIVAHPKFPIKDDSKFIDASNYIKQELISGNIPAMFKTVDIMHQPIPKERMDAPEHGDVVYIPGAITGGQRIMLTYNKFIDAYALSSNNIISPQNLPKFKGRDVIDDRVLQLEKAVGERIIYGLRNALHNEKIKYKDALPADIEKVLPQVLKDVQSSSWTSNRYSDVEAAMQATSVKERNELFRILNNPRLVPDLAKKIHAMSRENKYLPESISAVIYKPSRQREYQRADELDNIKKSTAKAYKTKAISLEAMAMEKVACVKTFQAFNKQTRSYEARVSWNPETIQKSAEILRDGLKPGEPFVISGQTPIWVSTAIATQIENPVYMQTKTYRVPVQNIQPVKTQWVNEGGIQQTQLTSQGVDFAIKKGAGALTVDVNFSQTDKQYYFSETNMASLQMPRIDIQPNTDVYLQGKCHPVVLASVAKSYMDQGCNVYCYNNHTKAYVCVNQDKLGQIHTQNDQTYAMQHSAQELQPVRAQTQQFANYDKHEEFAFTR